MISRQILRLCYNCDPLKSSHVTIHYCTNIGTLEITGLTDVLWSNVILSTHRHK